MAFCCPLTSSSTAHSGPQLSCNGIYLPLSLTYVSIYIYNKALAEEPHITRSSEMADRTERTVEELDVTEVCTKLQTACKTQVYLLYVQHNILSHFTLSHSITLHFQIHFNIITMSVIISQVIYTLSDCPSNMWCSVPVYNFYSLGGRRQLLMTNTPSSSSSSSSLLLPFYFVFFSSNSSFGLLLILLFFTFFSSSSPSSPSSSLLLLLLLPFSYSSFFFSPLLLLLLPLYPLHFQNTTALSVRCHPVQPPHFPFPLPSQPLSPISPPFPFPHTTQPNSSKRRTSRLFIILALCLNVH